ncbi:hypothetical protein BC834DRAFT_41777 [Gloeopeniophorella convolvens]|nr:hypothetical protein BC834DRAFT_41777 [Gloeopeniophorella convolvens]
MRSTVLFAALAALASFVAAVPSERGYAARAAVARPSPRPSKTPPKPSPRPQPSKRAYARPSHTPSPRPQPPVPRPTPSKSRRAYNARPSPSPRPPHPSPSPRSKGHGKRGEEEQQVMRGTKTNVKAQDAEVWDEERCPVPLWACPVRGALDADAFECVDLWADLGSCGGCATDDIVHDCTAIPHTRSVGCSAGRCVAHSCAEGYVVAPWRDACVRVRA